ncbi:MAG: hypothetical protein NC410_09100 [Oscillibacter sp.]|nr:hypothetical protein [Oscillibacter sp.]
MKVKMFERLKICWHVLTKKHYAAFFYHEKKKKDEYGRTPIYIYMFAPKDELFRKASMRYWDNVINGKSK